jgi:hypothetical protein
MSLEDFGTGVPQRQYESDRKEGIQRPSESSTLDLIRSKLQDPNFDAYELMRLVTYGMATLVMRMLRLGFTVEELYIRHGLYECIKPLRALGRSIIDTNSLRKRADVIFWDGEAIKHVSVTVEGWFLEAMTEARLTDFQREMVLRNYRDLAAANEPQLRRETER